MPIASIARARLTRGLGIVRSLTAMASSCRELSSTFARRPAFIARYASRRPGYIDQCGINGIKPSGVAPPIDTARRHRAYRRALKLRRARRSSSAFIDKRQPTAPLKSCGRRFACRHAHALRKSRERADDAATMKANPIPTNAPTCGHGIMPATSISGAAIHYGQI